MERYEPPRHTWRAKFAAAFRGVRLGTRGQNSFFVHVPVGAAVEAAAFASGCTLLEHCVLLLCIGVVLVAELANSGIERLARGVCREYNRDVGEALDIASGAVLVASFFAAVIGAAVFLSRWGWLGS